jgi:hypothetical protein
MSNRTLVTCSEDELLQAKSIRIIIEMGNILETVIIFEIGVFKNRI